MSSTPGSSCPEGWRAWRTFPCARSPSATSPPFALRTGGEPGSLAGVVRTRVSSVDALAAVEDVITLDGFIEREMSVVKVIGYTMTFFALLALVLSAMGTYGVIAHGVARRTRELGIRIALGAGSGSVLRLVLGSGAWQAGAGVVAGIPLALALRRGATGVGTQFRADAGGLEVVAVAALVLTGVCLLASYLPARRAARIDPIESLKSEGLRTARVPGTIHRG